MAPESEQVTPSSDVTPPEPVDSSALLASLSEDDRAHWRATGEIRDASATDRAPASEPESEPEPEKDAAPGQGDPAKPPESRPGKHNAETRKAQLAEEIQTHLRRRAELAEEVSRLERQAQALRTPPADVKPPESSPAKAEPDAPWKRYLAMPDAPKLESFQTYEEWETAMSVFVADQRYEERERARQSEQAKTARAKAYQDAQAELRTRIETAKTADPEFLTKVNPDVLKLTPRSALDPSVPVTAQHDLAEAILHSPHAPDWLLHLSAHPDDFARLVSLPDPPSLYREVGRMEATFEAQAAAKAPNTITNAPPPPTQLGRKPAAEPDAVEGALQRGDYRSYREEQNRREAARLKARA